MANDDDRRRDADGFGFFGSIEEFFDRIEEFQRRMEERDDVDVETNFSYRIDTRFDPDTPNRNGQPGFDRPGQGESAPGRRGVDADDLTADQPDILTRVTEGPEGPTLTADLTGTGIDPSTLDVTVADGTVTVTGPGGAVLMTESAEVSDVESVRVNNGVLEATLR